MAELDVGELSAKYNLPEWVVREELEETMSEVLSERFAYPVDVVFLSSGGIEFRSFRYRDGVLKSSKLDIGLRFIKPLMLRLIDTLAHRLAAKRIVGDYERMKSLVHRLVTGCVVNATPGGELYAEVGGSIGVCQRRDQPLSERGKYLPGQTYRFYVKRILPLRYGEDSKLEITLSRTSKSFVTRLLEDELAAADIFDVKIKCISRIVGGLSRVRSSERIPQKIVRKISDELKEKIYVECKRKRRLYNHKR
ncbi:MAG: hypothetical protein IEMM0002_1313 [bacterium]|nr:MAG: hypothetical protein IEMM0002_1313 [bacterium]